MKRSLGLPVQICAWGLAVAALLCLPFIPVVIILAALNPDRFVFNVAAFSIPLFIAPFLLLPASFCLFDWGRSLRRGGLHHGFCRRCSYDLRAATGDVCPECGVQT